MSGAGKEVGPKIPPPSYNGLKVRHLLFLSLPFVLDAVGKAAMD